MTGRPNFVARCSLASATLVLLLGMQGVAAQQSFASPDAAADALVDAIATSNGDGVRKVLGPEFRHFIPEGSVKEGDVYRFLGAWAKRHSVQMAKGGAGDQPGQSARLVVGEDDWAFPVPIVKTAKGWQFDMRAGKAEMNHRRIGRNELNAIDTLRMLCDAQERYRASVGNGKPATRLVSRPGQRDGLYWPSAGEGDASPLGADAFAMQPDVPADAAFHGYRFAVVPGGVSGAADGCAFVAWPATYGESGVHSFLIGPDRKILQRDFGRRSGAADYARTGTASPEWQAVGD